MQAKININYDNIYSDIRKYLLSVFPECEVIRGYSNNTPLPADDFILMNIINETELNTSINEYDRENEEKNITKSIEMQMQVDFFGDLAGERARTFSNLWRDFDACEHLEYCKPLYCDNVVYVNFVNEQSNFEDKYSVTIHLTYNTTVTRKQEFTDIVDLNIDLI